MARISKSLYVGFFFFSSRRRHTRLQGDWSSDVCSSDLPHYAMSGGTLIALAADEIVMDANAVLGPVDPQIGDMPAASIVRAVEIKGPQRVGDELLILADMAQKARVQVATFVAQVLAKHMPDKCSAQVA